MKPKAMLPTALQPGDQIEVLMGRWECVTAGPELDDGMVVVGTEGTRLEISPAAKLWVKRRAA